MELEVKKKMINPRNKKLSVRQQCDLIGLNRSTYYLKPKGFTPEDLKIMRRMDEIFTEHPYYGTRRMAFVLNSEGYKISRKRVRRYYVHLGLEAIYPKMNLSRRNFEHKVYPYLLKDVIISYPNHVWSADITYIRLREGFVYLVAIIDWYSRKILSWRLSNTLESTFCVEALEEALSLYNKPLIFNTDQGVQFTSKDFIKVLEAHEIAISMDSKGRALDNVFIERFWRSLKQEKIYRLDLETIKDARFAIRDYMEFYNTQRPHQSLDYKTPQEIYDLSTNQLTYPNDMSTYPELVNKEKKNQKKKGTKSCEINQKNNVVSLFKSVLQQQQNKINLINEITSLIH